MNDQERKKWLPLAVLAAALVVWTALLALGAFLQLGAVRPRHDWTKSLAMLGVLWIFLAGWGLALWLRARRNRP